MKKLFSILIILLSTTFVFADQKIESVRIRSFALTNSGWGDAVASEVRSYFSKGYVQVASFDSTQKCLLIMYDTSRKSNQKVISIRFHDFSFTNSGSGQAVVKKIRDTIGNKTISTFSYDSEQKCILVVYEN
jgi:hypothetical protein